VKVPAQILKGRAVVARLEAERKAAWPDETKFHEKFHEHRLAAEKLRKLEREHELAQSRPEPADDGSPVEAEP
jgi:hypothetical protein